MRITTERLALEPISLQYLESTYAYASDLENTRFMFFLPHESIEETREFILRAMEERRRENPAFYEFVILDGEKHVGGVSLYMLGDGAAELAWILDKRYWNNGYATEAARALMAWGRDYLGVRRFIAMCDSENNPSWRLMERLGMHRISLCGGRKNRSSDEERQELTYEILV